MIRILTASLYFSLTGLSAECLHPFAGDVVDKEKSIFNITLKQKGDVKATCIKDWLLLADFGRKKPEDKGIFGESLSYTSKLTSSGWHVQKGVKFYDRGLETPDEMIEFYATGEADGSISVPWVEGLDSIRLKISNAPHMIDKKNAIAFENSEGRFLLWEGDVVDDEDVVISGLSKYGTGRIIFIERTGTFKIDKVWAR